MASVSPSRRLQRRVFASGLFRTPVKSRPCANARRAMLSISKRICLGSMRRNFRNKTTPGLVGRSRRRSLASICNTFTSYLLSARGFENAGDLGRHLNSEWHLECFFATQLCLVARDEWPLLALSSRFAVCPPLVAPHVICSPAFCPFSQASQRRCGLSPGSHRQRLCPCQARRPSAHVYFAFLPDCLVSTLSTRRTCSDSG